MDATPFVVVAMLAIGGGFAVWRFLRPRRDRRSDAPLTAEATARFEAVLKSDPSATMVERLDLGDEVPEVSAHELQFRLFAWALNREQATEINTPAHEAIAAATAATLNDVSKDARYLPRRPQLLPQLMQVVNDDAASLRAIARLIARDPALTGNLLRIANSPIYRVNSMPIESIDRAVTLVGVQGVRAIIATALMQPVMSATSGAYGRFPELVWEHTLYAASAAEMHTVQVERAEPFISQLIGLLYGLSAIVVFRIVRDQFAAHPELSPTPGSFARLLETWVAPTAGRIAVSWELPERVQYALESQALAAELQMENALGRSLRFGRVAGSLVVLCRLGRISEAEARAIVVAGDTRRREVEKLWDRFAASSLRAASAQ